MRDLGISRDAQRIIEVVQGSHAEAHAFGELAMTSESAALRSLFFATTAMKKEKGADAEPRTLQQIGVLGGGLMGGGIASVTAINAALPVRIPVRIKDITMQGVNHALKTGWDGLSEKVKRRQLSAAQCQQQMARITGGIDY